MRSESYTALLLSLLSAALEAVHLCTITELDPDSKSQCNNTGYYMNCSQLHLNTTPQNYPLPNASFTSPLCLLNLAENNITQINDSSFSLAKNLNASRVVLLYLNFNQIHYIHSKAFENLTGLRYLNLSNNCLKWPDSFGHGVFKPLQSLENIYLKENRITTFDGLGSEMQYLKNLKAIFIYGCQNCVFGDGFDKLTNLTSVSLTGYNVYSNMTLVNSSIFVKVSQIRQLLMASCGVYYIPNNTFAPLKNLEFLDLSYNEHLGFENMSIALSGLVNSTTLKVLNVNKIHPLIGRGVELKVKHLKELNTLRALVAIHIDLNKIEVLEENITRYNLLPTSLRNLTMSGNRLTYDTYINYIYLNENISLIDLSRQHLSIDPFFREHFDYDLRNRKTETKTLMSSRCNKKCNCGIKNNTSICLPKNLTTIVWQKSFLNFDIGDVLICRGTNVNYLDLSFNLINKWIGPVCGLEKLKHLDLSENLCSTLQSDFFRTFPNLEYLNISFNDLGKSFQNENASKLFEQNVKLTVLDLSSNGIAQLPNDIFSKLTNLAYLNIRFNKLKKLNVSLENIKALKQLDVTGNKLETLSESLTHYLESRNCTIVMTGNPIDCSSCQSIAFITWLTKPDVQVQFMDQDVCTFDGKPKGRDDLTAVVQELEAKCKSQTWLVITIAVGCSAATCLFSLIVCLTMYKNRWRIRYLYYSRNRRHNHEGYEHMFENDAFISYPKSLSAFLRDQMIPNLEGIHGLRLWVADRNSQAGASVAENITHGIYTSRKSVLLVNREYLKDNWCDYEMNMAQVESVETKRKLLIIILMENSVLNECSINVLRILKSETTVEFPNDNGDIDSFWKTLACEIYG